ncbi:MAG: bacteriohopanetetrol glucosamine biosynthesis glycosyltransferase HpnI [Proteobacteria bacterium]|nr:bacteriohopanetetrol glucosamine biosynthesis glycosyltransferase HpnI [Pseudomonadota bacterium]
MQIEIFNIYNISIALICLCSAGYLISALVAVEIFNLKRKKSNTSKDFHPPVTILKPIYGLDPELAENLRSFCRQDYPKYQIIFGLQDKNDPAIPVIEKIITEFKDIDVNFIVDPRRYGTNHKVSNLINMAPTAKHDYLLIADSDMRVPNNYLINVMSPFTDATVGAVTCLYSGSARGKLASSLNAMFINEWFFPSVLISRIIQPIKYCLGATMIVRRNLLNEIGGFRSLSNYLADDYMLGKLINDLGYNIHLSDFVVENIVEEASIKDLLTHELRWARTLRRVEPLAYAFTFLTDTLVISSLAAFTLYTASHSLIWSMLPVLLALIARSLLHIRTKQITGSISAGSICLIPLRDLLSFCVRVISYTGNSVQWRKNEFSVDQAGLIHTKQKCQLEPDNAEEIPDLATSQDY